MNVEQEIKMVSRLLTSYMLNTEANFQNKANIEIYNDFCYSENVYIKHSETVLFAFQLIQQLKERLHQKHLLNLILGKV